MSGKLLILTLYRVKACSLRLRLVNFGEASMDGFIGPVDVHCAEDRNKATSH